MRKKNTEFSRKKPVSGKTKRVGKGAKFCLEEFFLRIHLFFENNSFSVNLFWLWANTHRTFSETKCCIPRVEKKSFGKKAFCEGKNSFIKNFWLPLSFFWAMMRNKGRFFFDCTLSVHKINLTKKQALWKTLSFYQMQFEPEDFNVWWTNTSSLTTFSFYRSEEFFEERFLSWRQHIFYYFVLTRSRNSSDFWWYKNWQFCWSCFLRVEKKICSDFVFREERIVFKSSLWLAARKFWFLVNAFWG